MKIPKYILHPTLLILAALGIYYLIKIPTPSASQPIINKKEILDQNNLHQIVDFTADGYLIISEIEKKVLINDQRFKNLPNDKLTEVRDFFVGRFVKVQETKITDLDLPIELYDPLCFGSEADQRKSFGLCPVILEK